MRLKKFNEMFDPMGSWNPKQLEKEELDILHKIVNELQKNRELMGITYNHNCVKFFLEGLRSEINLPFISISLIDNNKNLSIVKEEFDITDTLGIYSISEVDKVISLILKI